MLALHHGLFAHFIAHALLQLQQIFLRLHIDCHSRTQLIGGNVHGLQDVTRLTRLINLGHRRQSQRPVGTHFGQLCFFLIGFGHRLYLLLQLCHTGNAFAAQLRHLVDQRSL